MPIFDVLLMLDAYPENILVLGWHEGVSAIFSDDLALANYELGLESQDAFSTVSSSGVYSGIRFSITLRRKLTYHLLQVLKFTKRNIHTLCIVQYFPLIVVFFQYFVFRRISLLHFLLL